MKGSGIIAVILVAAIQTLLFVFIWDWIVAVATDFGREQRGGTAFGITVYYGAFVLGFTFLIASAVSAVTARNFTRWSVIGGLLVGWSAWVVPSLSSYPIRGSVYFFLGALILIFGSGIVVPIVSKALDRFTGRGVRPIHEQGGDGQSATRSQSK